MIPDALYSMSWIMLDYQVIDEQNRDKKCGILSTILRDFSKTIECLVL